MTPLLYGPRRLCRHDWTTPRADQHRLKMAIKKARRKTPAEHMPGYVPYLVNIARRKDARRVYRETLKRQMFSGLQPQGL